VGKGNEEICISRITHGRLTDNAFRLGKALGRGYKRWLSE
jgi:hypothetical protein